MPTTHTHRPAQQFAHPLPRRAEEVAAVRAWAGERLGGVRRRDEILLAVSELVTNAVCHAPAQPPGAGVCGAVLLRIGPDRIEVRVRNRATPGHRPAVRAADPDAESGRGLLLIDTMADAWGTVTGYGSVTVWARFVQDGAR